MNDNELEIDGLSEWVDETLDRHDPGIRADSPRSAITVLLTDAAHDLTAAPRRTFDEQAFSAETLKTVVACAATIADVIKLAPLCPDQPQVVNVTEAEDGTLKWAPAATPSHA